MTTVPLISPLTLYNLCMIHHEVCSLRVPSSRRVRLVDKIKVAATLYDLVYLTFSQNISILTDYFRRLVAEHMTVKDAYNIA